MRVLVSAISGLFLVASSAFASTLVVTETGTFSNSTPSSAISAAGEMFSFRFNVNSTPAVSAVVPGSEFDVAFSNFSYLLNGVAVSAPVGGITFFNSSSLGLFNICFVTACGSSTEVLSIRGAQAYSGTEGSPTLLIGNYPVASALISVGTSINPLATDTSVLISQASTAVTPEPSTFILLSTGLTGLLSLTRRRFCA